MATITKDDLKKMIREIVDEAFADKVEEIQAKAAEANRKFADKLLTPAPQPPEKPEKGIRAARILRALAAAHGDPDRAARIAKDLYRDEFVAKVLAESTLQNGGAIVFPEFASEVIDLLAAQAVVRSMGVTAVPMSSNTLTIPYLSSGSTANYVGELQNIPVTGVTFGQLTLSAKKLAAIVPVSNDLLRDASPLADNIVRNDVVRAMGLREDLAFIRDDGNNNKPKGMRYWADPSNVFASSGTTLDKVLADLLRMIRVLKDKNVPLRKAGWIFTPRTENFLMGLLDGTGHRVFWDEMQQGKLLGFPYKTTTQIPDNLGAGGNESEVYFADFDSLIIAENQELIVNVFPGGAYFDGTQVRSGISTDETVIQVIARHDFGARHAGKEIAVLTGVTWGA